MHRLTSESLSTCSCSNLSALWQFLLNFFFKQGLRPGVPAEAPTMIFATPTKMATEAGPAVEYMGSNRVPDFQRIFQVRGRKSETFNKNSISNQVYPSNFLSKCVIALHKTQLPKEKHFSWTDFKSQSHREEKTCNCSQACRNNQ